MATSRRNGRVVGPVLAAVLVLGVIGLAVVPRLVGGGHGAGGATGLKTVRVLAGSETAPYLNDPKVAARLATEGYKLVVDTAGSREIVNRKLTNYDIAFPSNATQAEQIRQNQGVTRASYTPFSTPMAIATFTPIERLLATAGVTQTDKSGTTFFDMKTYLDLVAKKTRWSQLKGNVDYPTDKSVLISSTDVRTSNSAALYLALASYVANDNNVVADPATATTLADTLAPLFLLQGFLDSTTQEPYADYLSIGMSKTPMVMIYESQFRASQFAKDGSITGGRVLMYPSPTIYAKHTVVPLTDAGDAVGRLLTTDPELQDRAAFFGFRTADVARMTSSSKQAAITVPPQLVNVVDPPTQNISETMIKRIDAKYRQGSGG
ncbi:hypothetical protein [Pseudofrankia inefficax]|uniref:Extracellular solute-binding protein n=1 Tax=Pseudofrankia inefficax (strain DSM 45817 / CECT 9037 / DDB 130130 / EuI1c) TaxID=298654 RepID=E3IXU6_PSEI1|nr:hypothetical protein [Pseudofrankia inefficax]ADP80255.1 hypothetical protein FraEuI1c_2216 [Pseudofrankia inefficax]